MTRLRGNLFGGYYPRFSFLMTSLGVWADIYEAPWVEGIAWSVKDTWL